MYTTEFQVEPPPTYGRIESGKTAGALWCPDKQAQASIESILLALRFRNWLGDSEKNFLDLLAPEHSVIFLIHNRDYLHPEGVPLFPMDLIKTALDGGGQAIFTHRYEPSVKADYDCYKVHTARVSPSDRDELILGLLGPDNIFDASAADDHFGRLVEMFRNAWKATDKIERRLAPEFDGEKPVLLINRASGRVMMAGRRLSELVKVDPNQLTDVEYSEVSHLLTEKAGGARLRLENLATEPIQLCLATVTPGADKSRDAEAEKLLADPLIHIMRNKLAGITAAASHLGSLAEEVDAREEIELSEIVLGEALQLDHELDRLLTLFTYERLPKKVVLISGSVDEALNFASAKLSDKADIGSNLLPSDRSIECPPPALSILIESVLLSHLAQRRNRSRTDIELELEPDHTVLHIRTEMTNVDPERTFVRVWETCSRQLAEQMSCRLTNEVNSEANGFSSTLRIPNQQ